MPSRRKRYDYLKRLLDVTAASVGLVTLSPVMLIIALLVAKQLGRPILFKQQRPGLQGKLFTLYKFRSMRNVDIEKGLISPADRITKFGAALRSTSLDELPSLINVVRGEMSIVGPRPLLPKYLPLYTRQQARRHEARPGITGLAQVSGRNGLAWPNRLALDTVYVRKRSLALDVMIIVRTMRVVISREGVSESGQVSVRQFTGTELNGKEK